MLSVYKIRLATIDDAAIIARHRAAMFFDMGYFSVVETETIEANSLPFLREMLASGEYRGWLIEFEGQVVAGGGMMLRRLLPRLHSIAGGQEAYILNMYTDREHRRKNLARQLMQSMIDWCQENKIGRVSLHSSDEGRPLYESLGFGATNEMMLQKK
jgi:GNAT superfamily N-acetyltransferase